MEGKYDQIRLSALTDALILRTDGFGIFKDENRKKYISRIAENGIIVLTDSDSAGFLIRNHIKGAVPASLIKHAYVPEISLCLPRSLGLTI